MSALKKHTFMAALAFSILPVHVPAGEAPGAGAAPRGDPERRLADAQRRLDDAAREVAEISTQLGRRFNLRIGTDPGNGPPPRALLGVNIDRASGREGARVMDVSPGGAAAEAGIKPGDIITAIADLDLTQDSDPSRALVEKMNQLEPDQKVKVGVLRDGRKLTFDIAPRPAPQDVVVRRQELRAGGPDVPGPAPRRAVPGVPGIALPNGGAAPRVQPLPELIRGDDADTRFGGAELASLSDRLGSYFGVKSGVLVVRAGVDSPFKLQDGDVILAVDGREVTSAQQAGRILRSYQPGEKLTLKVQRDRKALNLEVTAPGGRRPN